MHEKRKLFKFLMGLNEINYETSYRFHSQWVTGSKGAHYFLLQKNYRLISLKIEMVVDSPYAHYVS